MILVTLLINLMAFNIPTETVITDDDIPCNEKRLHSEMVKVMFSSGRVTITFFSCGFGFTVCRINVTPIITVESSTLPLASCRAQPGTNNV